MKLAGVLCCTINQILSRCVNRVIGEDPFEESREWLCHSLESNRGNGYSVSSPNPTPKTFISFSPFGDTSPNNEKVVKA